MVSMMEVYSAKLSLTELPPQTRPTSKHAKKWSNNNNKMRDKYAKSKRINAVVAAIQRGDFVYFSNIAKKYGYSWEAISRRVRGLTKLKKQVDSF